MSTVTWDAILVTVDGFGFGTLTGESCLKNVHCHTDRASWDAILATNVAFGALTWKKCAQSHSFGLGRVGGDIIWGGGGSANREPGSYMHISFGRCSCRGFEKSVGKEPVAQDPGGGGPDGLRVWDRADPLQPDRPLPDPAASLHSPKAAGMLRFSSRNLGCPAGDLGRKKGLKAKNVWGSLVLSSQRWLGNLGIPPQGVLLQRTREAGCMAAAGSKPFEDCAAVQLANPSSDWCCLAVLVMMEIKRLLLGRASQEDPTAQIFCAVSKSTRCCQHHSRVLKGRGVGWVASLCHHTRARRHGEACQNLWILLQVDLMKVRSQRAAPRSSRFGLRRRRCTTSPGFWPAGCKPAGSRSAGRVVCV